MSYNRNINSNIIGRKFVLNGIRVVGLLIMFALPIRVASQACCSGGIPLGGSLGLGSADNKSLQALLTYDYNAINNLVSFSELLDDQTRSRTTHSSLLEINYGINSRLSVAGVLSYIRQKRSIKGFEGLKDITSAQGFGDLVVLLKYRLTNPMKYQNFDIVIGGGPKIPTAKTNFTNNQGLLLAADMQPGSGSLDGIFWAYLYKGGLLNNPNLGLTSVATFRYSGENKNYFSTQSYQFGNELQINIGLNYNLFIKKPVDVFTFLRYRKQSEDLIDGGVFPSSGGEWIYAIPGVNINFTPWITSRISGDIPVYRKLEGTQLTTSYKLTIAFQFNIPFNRNELFIY